MDILGLVDVSNWLLIFIAVLLLFYYYSTFTFNTWIERGIPGPKPYPMVGNLLPIFTKGLAGHSAEIRKYGKVVGAYDGRVPALYVFDLDMLKEILVKQFDCFTNRPKLEGFDGAANKFMSILQDDEWRNVRNHVTPTFTSGKMKRMFKMITECGSLLKGSMLEHTRDKAKFDTKKLCGGYTMDVIARTAFGIEVNSQKDPDNEFIKHAESVFSLKLASLLIILLLFFPPGLKILKSLGLGHLVRRQDQADAEAFFTNIAKVVMEQRKSEKTASDRVDFLQLMVEAQAESSDKSLSIDVITANAMLFFAAGYETTATSLTMLSYNLVMNPEIQDKLCEEIDEILKDKEELDYESLQKVPYLDQCIEESLRLYPPAARLERMCNRDVIIKGVTIRKGEKVNIPVESIHTDEENYPDPLKFDPDRFSPENKETHRFSWMPFGAGPRNCVAMRLALLELRVAMVTILRTHKFVKVPDTPEKLTPKLQGLLAFNETIYLGLQERQRS